MTPTYGLSLVRGAEFGIVKWRNILKPLVVYFTVTNWYFTVPTNLYFSKFNYYVLNRNNTSIIEYNNNIRATYIFTEWSQLCYNGSGVPIGHGLYCNCLGKCRLFESSEYHITSHITMWSRSYDVFMLYQMYPG